MKVSNPGFTAFTSTSRTHALATAYHWSVYTTTIMYYTVQILETLSVFEKGFFFFSNAVAGRRDSHQTRMLTHVLLPPFLLVVVWCPHPWGGRRRGWGGMRGTDGRFSQKEKKQGRQEMSLFVERKRTESKAQL